MINFKNWFKVAKPPTEIELAVQRLQALDSEKYRNAYSSDMSLCQWLVYDESICQYTQRLRSWIQSLESDQLIPLYQIPSEMKRVYLRDFLKDQHGLFVDIPTRFKEFIDTISELLLLYQAIEQRSEKSFSSEKNLMYLQHVITHLLNLCKEVL